MSTSVNKVMMIGNLTMDPELKYLPNGSAVCNLNVALNRSWSDKATGEKKEEVSFIGVVAFGRTGELAAQYLKKGRQVFIEGRLKQDRWETDGGEKRSKTHVVAENIQFLGGKKDGQDAASPEDEVEA